MKDPAIGSISISKVNASKVRPQLKALNVVGRKAYHRISSYAEHVGPDAKILGGISSYPHRLIEVGRFEGVEDVRWTEQASLILSLALPTALTCPGCICKQSPLILMVSFA